MDSWISQTELDAVQHADRKTPYLIRGVSQSYFSVARYYGGATFNGSSYIYFAATDELVRDDIVKLVKKLRRKARV